MIAGLMWALIGYAICEMTNRGKLTTTIVTAVAGALGLGSGVLQGSSHAVLVALFVLELAAGGAGALVLGWSMFGRKHRTLPVYFIACTRQVMADEIEQTGQPLTVYGRAALAGKRRPAALRRAR